MSNGGMMGGGPMGPTNMQMWVYILSILVVFLFCENYVLKSLKTKLGGASNIMNYTFVAFKSHAPRWSLQTVAYRIQHPICSIVIGGSSVICDKNKFSCFVIMPKLYCVVVLILFNQQPVIETTTTRNEIDWERLS